MRGREGGAEWKAGWSWLRDWEVNAPAQQRGGRIVPVVGGYIGRRLASCIQLMVVCSEEEQLVDEIDAAVCSSYMQGSVLG